MHADLKPDNILIEFDGEKISGLKLIDFGSAFLFNNATNITATTPEYLAPEVLQFLENRSSKTNGGSSTSNLCQT